MIFLRIIRKEKKHYWIVILQKITKPGKAIRYLKKGEIQERRLTAGHI